VKIKRGENGMYKNEQVAIEKFSEKNKSRDE
jgi:hypothetical protein